MSIVPEDSVNHYSYLITVEHRGDGRWAVLHTGACLSRDGEWDWEPSSSNREDDWLDNHRFSRQEALDRAAAAAPHITVNGFTVQDGLDNSATRSKRAT